MTLALHNDWLEIQVRPERGGRIDQIYDRRLQRDWLWHPPGYVALSDPPVAAGAGFDASWTGGFEEMFPNDGAGELPGRILPDHGELWSARWRVQQHTAHEIVLVHDCVTLPVTVEKQLRLRPDRAELEVSWSLLSRAAVRLPYMLKLHPALNIEAGDRIELPPCSVEPVDTGFSRLIGQPGLSQWPWGRGGDGSPVRLDLAHPVQSGLREFIYASNLSQGRCALRHAASGSCFELLFDRSDFPFVWVLASYGGFDGRQLLLLEPCTSKPWDLGEAMQRGTAAWLRPGEERHYRVRVLISAR